MIRPIKSIMMAQAPPTGPPFNPLVSLRDCKVEVEFRLNEIRKTLANEPIPTSELQAKIDDADIAWIGFCTHHRWLSSIAGRGRLLGLKAYHSALKRWFLAHINYADAVLKEEQAKNAVLDKVIMVGGEDCGV